MRVSVDDRNRMDLKQGSDTSFHGYFWLRLAECEFCGWRSSDTMGRSAANAMAVPERAFLLLVNDLMALPTATR